MSAKLKGDSLGDRMKRYERVSEARLLRRLPVVIRIDGRAFHTLTRQHFGRGYDAHFVSLMIEVARRVQREIAGCDFAYGQSDEVSFLLTDYRTIHTEPWFDYDVAKLASITAAVASANFTALFGHVGCFDSRAFTVPPDDAVNYFIWRQQDATRNAVQMAGREHFSHRELHGKSGAQIQEMLFQERGINFNNYPTARKRGYCVVNTRVDLDIPIFTQNRDYVDRFVHCRED